jgi:type IV pilus assembly protein PilY1
LNRVLPHPSQRTDCAAEGGTQCTWAEEAQNFANWYLYYRNRLFAAQAVMADAMSSLTSTSQQRLRVGFGRFSPTGAASGIEAADVVYYIAL